MWDTQTHTVVLSGNRQRCIMAALLSSVCVYVLPGISLTVVLPGYYIFKQLSSCHPGKREWDHYLVYSWFWLSWKLKQTCHFFYGLNYKNHWQLQLLHLGSIDSVPLFAISAALILSAVQSSCEYPIPPNTSGVLLDLVTVNALHCQVQETSLRLY